MFCEKCGTKLPEGSRFCLNCGAKAAIEESIQNTAVQEAAVSTDALVLETAPAAVEAGTVEMPVEQPAALYETTEPKPVQEQTEQAPVQPIQEKAVQPPQTQLKQEAVQQAQVQQTQAQPKPAQSQARAAAQASQPATVKASQPIAPQAPQNLQQPAFQQSNQQVIAPARQAEADPKPEKLKPLQTWKFIGMFIITAIPVINLIFVLIWSFSSGFNKNTKSYARAVLILWIVELLLLIITAIVNWALIQSLWSTFSTMSSGMPIY